MLQKVDAQHPFQTDRRPDAFAFGIRRRNHGDKLRPWHHALHLGLRGGLRLRAGSSRTRVRHTKACADSQVKRSSFVDWGGSEGDNGKRYLHRWGFTRHSSGGGYRLVGRGLPARSPQRSRLPELRRKEVRGSENGPRFHEPVPVPPQARFRGSPGRGLRAARWAATRPGPGLDHAEE